MELGVLDYDICCAADIVDIAVDVAALVVLACVLTRAVLICIYGILTSYEIAVPEQAVIGTITESQRLCCSTELSLRILLCDKAIILRHEVVRYRHAVRPEARSILIDRDRGVIHTIRIADALR